mmetsp:Transcript_38155/g.89489  ORF Transcript_38155/g.89489 Transcript_38155/m.89489 type:complete len:371 (-) Transcript_38155:247-1359(-)
MAFSAASKSTICIGRTVSGVADTSASCGRALIGPMAASLLRAARSEHEYPCVADASFPRSFSESFWEAAEMDFSTRARRAAASGRGIRMRRGSRRSTASSSSIGRFVAPSTRILSASASVAAPSSCTKNSVLSRRAASCSLALRLVSIESISSMKMTDGCIFLARLKRARICFSDSPTHFDTSDEAEMLKKVDSHSVATAFANMVLPLPGGPNKRTPFGGRRMPENSFGFLAGAIMISQNSRFTSSKPTMLSQAIPGASSSTSLIRAFSCSSKSGGGCLPAASPGPPPLPPTDRRFGAATPAAPPLRGGVLPALWSPPPLPRPLPPDRSRGAGEAEDCPSRRLLRAAASCCKRSNTVLDAACPSRDSPRS